MDVEALKNYLNCDNTFLLSMVQKFIEELDDTTNKINLSFQNQNLTSIKLNAHKLLSSVKIMQLKELEISLEKIELQAISKINSPELAVEIEKLNGCVQKTIQDMKEAIHELDT